MSAAVVSQPAGQFHAVIYHSAQWGAMVERGYVTAFTEIIHGECVAFMLWEPARGRYVVRP